MIVPRALLILAVVVCCSCSEGHGERVASPTPLSTATVELTPDSSVDGRQPTPDPTEASDIDAVFGVEVIELRRGDAVPLPAGIVLYARDGVWEGAGGDLTRYYVDADGEFRADDLVVSRHGQDPLALQRAYGPAAGDLWVDMCHGICYGSPDPVTTMRSLDGGITWQTVFETSNNRPAVIGSYGTEIVLRQWDPAGTLHLFEGNIGGTIVALGAQASIPANVDAIAASGVAGIPTLAVSDDGRTIWDVRTGAVVATVPIPNPFQRIRIDGFAPGSDGKELMVSWYGPGGPPNWEWYFGWLDLETGKFSRVMKGSQDRGIAPMYGVQWLSPGRVIARAGFNASDFIPGHVDWFGGIPALIDFESSVVSPIAEFVPLVGAKSGGPVPVAVETGKFVRVSTGADCLNVRAEPAVSAPVLACYAGGVMLRLRSDSGPEPGWSAVVTRDGREAWAASDFLSGH